MIDIMSKLPRVLEMPGAGMRVRKIDPLIDDRWVTFVLAHPESTIYHHPAWIKVLQDEFPQPSEHLACEDATGRVLAVLPLLRTQGLPFNLGGALAGRRISSLPRTPLAGPLSANRGATAAILSAALALCGQHGSSQLQIKACGPDLDDVSAGLVRMPWRLSYILELPGVPNGEFRIIDSHDRARIKWSVNKAAKLGVTVRSAETDSDLRAWYAGYLETMQRNVVLPRPFRFFASLWKELRPLGMMELLIADHFVDGQRRMIAGSIFLRFGHTVSYVFSGMHRKYSSLRANDAIQWRAIHDACRHGFHYFDFGEVPDGNVELAKFKSKWGARPKRLIRYCAATPVAPCEETSELRSGYVGSLTRHLWGRLPPKATSWLGDRIYSYL